MARVTKVSDYVIEFLKKSQVKNIFTVSGGGSMHLIDSIGKSDINFVCTHHEQAAAMAAEGDARMGGISAVVVTTGPGGTNTLTGILGSWLDSIPVIYISGQVPTSQLSAGTGCRQIGDQEFDIISVVKSITKYAVMIEDKNEIKYHLEKAYVKATTGRPGPVWIDIPLDIQGASINEDSLEGFSDPPERPIATPSDIEFIKQKLRLSKKPVVVVGSGIRRSKAVHRLRNFLSVNNIPVMTGPHSGVDIVNDDYKHYMGRFGVLGQPSSNEIIQKSDLLISIGSRLNIKMTGYKYDSFAECAYKVLVDIDKNEMNKYNVIADKKIVSDAGDFLSSMDNRRLTDEKNISSWLRECKQIRSSERLILEKHRKKTDYASTYCFIESLCHKTPEDTPIVTSDGTAHVVTLKTARLKGNQRLFTNVGCASMGYGLPAAIGASFAINKGPVVCIEGDGSIQMNIQELQTVVHHQLPMKIFIINNDGYLSIRLTQDSFFDGRHVAIDKGSGVSFPDMKKIASAYGIKYYQIKTNEDINFTLDKVMGYNEGPCLCEVFTDPREKHEPKVMAKLKEDGTFEPGKLTDIRIYDE